MKSAEAGRPDADVNKYLDALVMSHYRDSDYEQEIVISRGANKHSKSWRREKIALADLVAELSRHRVGATDGAAIVFADMVPGQRLKNSVIATTAIGLYLDIGLRADVVDSALLNLGCLAVRYTAHSNGKINTDFKKDIIRKHFPNGEITTAIMREFARKVEQWDESIASTVEVTDDSAFSDEPGMGIVVRVSHAPMPRHRITVFLAEPYVIANEGKTQAQALAKWAKITAALAAKLGLPFDKKGTDPSRLFYLPRHPKDAPFSISLFGGPLFDFKSLDIADGARHANDEFIFGSEDALIDAINKRYCLARIGSSTRIIDEGESRIEFLKMDAAAAWLKPYKLTVQLKNGDRLEDGFRVWMDSPKRRHYSRVVFAPGQTVSDSHYNLWKGFAIQPAKGDWSLMRAHLFDIICDGDLENFIWLVSWFAQMLQEPSNKPGTAIVIRSKALGSGKSSAIGWLVAMLGHYAVTMSQPKHFLGNFNAHFETALLAVAEEAFWAGTKEAEGVIKHLVTGLTHRIERKGVDSIETPNHTRIAVLANSDWVVPAALGERRFFVLDINESQAKNPAYFTPLFAQAEDGGIAAMLYDLLKFDFSSVDLRNPPNTKGLAGQKRESFNLEMHWWYEILSAGEIVGPEQDETDQDGKDWAYNEQLDISRSDLFASYSMQVPKINGKPPTKIRMGQFLREVLGGEIGEVRDTEGIRERRYLLPPLAVARECFRRKTGLEFESQPPPSAPGENDAGIEAMIKEIDRSSAMAIFEGEGN